MVTDHDALSLTLFSPAKVNLFLRVVGRRSDGYHELVSLMQTLSLGDRLTLQRVADPAAEALHCSGLPLSAAPQDNLVMRAIALFRRRSAVPLYVKAALHKEIPAEAGLGGGSGNAATALWAMNELAGRPCSTQLLQQWAGELGSDVPFFLSEGTALCRGRGELVAHLPPLPAPSVSYLVRPPFGVATPAVYRALRCHELPQRCCATARRRLAAGDFAALFNDLEEAAHQVEPRLAAVAASLPPLRLLCGSGSCYFCVGEPASAAWPAGWLLRRVTFINRAADGWYQPC